MQNILLHWVCLIRYLCAKFIPMRTWTGLFIFIFIITACEDDNPDAPLVYAPEQIERLLLTNGESTNWVRAESQAGNCQAFDTLNFQPVDSLEQVLFLQTYTVSPCIEPDSFFVSFVDVQGTATTNMLQLAQRGDTSTYTLNLLTSQRLELSGPFAASEGEQRMRYQKAEQ